MPLTTLPERPAGVVSCDGCGEDCYAWANPRMDCVRARARAAMTHRCTCPRSKRRERMIDAGHRRWVACDRCLAAVRNLPDAPRKGA